jgi:hypothetical protein
MRIIIAVAIFGACILFATILELNHKAEAFDQCLDDQRRTVIEDAGFASHELILEASDEPAESRKFFSKAVDACKDRMMVHFG